MSRDFASFMASISEDSAEQKVRELMEILDKVMQIIMNSTDQLFTQLMKLETNINHLMGRITKLESQSAIAAPGQPIPSAGAPGMPAAAAAPAPKPAPKPMSPVSARSALQSELKQLFARRKQQ
ncbi:MAG: hypothetical protein HWN66_01600 [Candidatus Helarchaeota archaeon]|nr:hypothetical protein [Candidatus Helarchaeota archaeon]